MNYPLMEPPFPIKRFEEMTKKEARVHFDWYIGQIPDRIAMLQDAFHLTPGQPKDILDFSHQSLNEVWEWFREHIQVQPKSKEEIARERARVPEQWQRFLILFTITISRAGFGPFPMWMRGIADRCR